MVSLGNTVAIAADCEGMHDAISKERVLIKKKTQVEAAVGQCPGHPGIAYQHGYVLERFRKYKEALAGYNRAIEIDPGYAKAYFSIGDIHVLQNNYEKAVKAYQDGLQQEPGDARAINSLNAILAKHKVPAGVNSNIEVISAKPVGKGGNLADNSKSAPNKARQYTVIPVTRLEIPFEAQTAVLSQEARDVLSVVVGQAMNRADMSDSKFEVGGHTENLGSEKKNDDIARKRAVTVQKYLVENFAISDKRLTTVGHGSKKPKSGMNSRVDFARID